ncbi:MAG: tetrahydrofolate dehydrogenase/cyclohydrolase catalytic domain-containing protein, partial [Patescibacteria group bacterium]
MIIDGRALAKEILARAKTRAAKLARPPLVVALTESDTPVTHSYLAVKTKCATDAGCIFEVKHINKLLRPLEIVDMARTADALIIQLPLPKEMDTKEMCDAIPVGKDADVLSSAARARFEMMDLRNPSLLPPVVGAVKKILEYGKVNVEGKSAVVIGDGWLVGNPCAKWLAQQGAEVEIITLETGGLRNCATPGVA